MASTDPLMTAADGGGTVTLTEHTLTLFDGSIAFYKTARGDDSKGFGALGEAGVVFAASRPAGRRNQTGAVFGDEDVAKASPLKETSNTFRTNDASIGDRPVAIESDVDVDARRREPAKKQSAFSDGTNARFVAARVCSDDDASRDRKTPDVRARARVDDGFGLTRCRGSGLRLPPPPALLPRAAEAPSLSRVIHDRRVAAVRARGGGATTTIREARRGLGEKTWR